MRCCCHAQAEVQVGILPRETNIVMPLNRYIQGVNIDLLMWSAIILGV